MTAEIRSPTSVRQFLTNYDFTDRLIIRAHWPWRRRSPDSPDGVPKLIPSLGKPGSTAYTSVRDMRKAVRRMSSSTWSRRTCSSKGGGAGARPTTQALGGGARGVRTAAFRDDPGRQVHPRVAAAAASAAEAAAAATARASAATDAAPAYEQVEATVGAANGGGSKQKKQRQRQLPPA